MKSIVSTHLSSKLAPILGPKFFKWMLRSGTTILFWEDWWISDVPLCQKFPDVYNLFLCTHVTVSEFLPRWKRHVIDYIHSWPEHLHTSVQISHNNMVSLLKDISLTEGKERLIWMLSNGTFTSKAGSVELFKMNAQITSNHSVWNLIWSIKSPPKIQSFLWRLNWGILPTRSFLNSRLKLIADGCEWCKSCPESTSHLFWDCEPAKWTWDFIGRWWSLHAIRIRDSNFSLLRLLSTRVFPAARGIWHLVVAAALWSLWLARNELIF